jgi:hypothetical protein
MLMVMTGTSVTVYGTIGPLAEHLESTYILDGSSSSPFITPTISSPSYHQPFYQSPLLNYEQHTLTIIPSTGMPGAGPHLWLDYFVITQPLTPNSTRSSVEEPSNSPVAPQSSNVTSTGTSMAAATMPTAPDAVVSSTEFAFATMSNLPNSSAHAISSTQPPVHRTAIIVGSAVGGVLVLLIITLSVWRYRRRKSHRMCVSFISHLLLISF